MSATGHASSRGQLTCVSLPCVPVRLLSGAAGIMLFSSASPLAALLTYFTLSALPFLSDGSSIPLAVLFSGGTVLYAGEMLAGTASAVGQHCWCCSADIIMLLLAANL